MKHNSLWTHPGHKHKITLTKITQSSERTLLLKEMIAVRKQIQYLEKGKPATYSSERVLIGELINSYARFEWLYDKECKVAKGEL